MVCGIWAVPDGLCLQVNGGLDETTPDKPYDAQDSETSPLMQQAAAPSQAKVGHSFFFSTACNRRRVMAEWMKLEQLQLTAGRAQ